MVSEQRSFRFRLAVCPYCKSRNVRVVRELANLACVAADVVLALFAVPLVPYRLRCSDCEREFSPDIEQR